MKTRARLRLAPGQAEVELPPEAQRNFTIWEVLLPLLALGFTFCASTVVGMLAEPQEALSWFGCSFP